MAVLDGETKSVRVLGFGVGGGYEKPSAFGMAIFRGSAKSRGVWVIPMDEKFDALGVSMLGGRFESRRAVGWWNLVAEQKVGDCGGIAGSRGEGQTGEGRLVRSFERASGMSFVHFLIICWQAPVGNAELWRVKS